MKALIVMVLAILVPQVANARMYMCVDEATGATTFTDVACATPGTSEEIRVNEINPGNGVKQQKRRRHAKVWRSDADVRRTGEDFNAERRALYQGTTASTR